VPEVKLLLKAVDEASSAIKQADGNLKAYGQQALSANDKVNRLSSSLISGLIPAMTAAGAVAFLKGASDAASKHETEILRLKGAVERVGVSYDVARPAIDAFANSVKASTKYGGDEARVALARMVGATGSLTDQTILATRAAIDFASATGGDTVGAVKLVVAAMNGQLRGIQRLVPELRSYTADQWKAVDANERQRIITEALTKAYGGAASEIDELAKANKRYEDSWNGLKLSIGAAENKTGAMEHVLGMLTAQIRTITSAISLEGSGVIDAFLKWNLATAGVSRTLDLFGFNLRDHLAGWLGETSEKAEKAAASMRLLHKEAEWDWSKYQAGGDAAFDPWENVLKGGAASAGGESRDEAAKAAQAASEGQTSQLLSQFDARQRIQEYGLEQARKGQEALAELRDEQLQDEQRSSREAMAADLAAYDEYAQEKKERAERQADALEQRAREEGEALHEAIQESLEKQKQAWEDYGDAAGSAMDAVIGGMEAFGASQQAMAIAVEIATVAQAAIKGAYEVAEAMAAFAIGNIPGGLAHSAAAAQYAAVAATTISEGPQEGSGGGTSAGGGSTGSSASTWANRDERTARLSDQPQSTYVVNQYITGSYVTESEAGRKSQQAIDQARRNGTLPTAPRSFRRS
jgi:hypothetical protein